MKRHLVNKFDKKKLPALPKVSFDGRIVVVLTENVAQKAVDFLLTQKLLGIDTETRPSFTKGKQYKVALLQVSTYDTCFLFRLNHLGNSPAVQKLLQDTSVPKIGLSLHDDMKSLSKRITFEKGLFIDLQDIVSEIGIEDKSLAKMYANIFGGKISKREQLSNWEADVLSEKQKRYAALDAWACIKIYEEYIRLKETGEYELEIIPEEIPTAQTTVVTTEENNLEQAIPQTPAEETLSDKTEEESDSKKAAEEIASDKTAEKTDSKKATQGTTSKKTVKSTTSKTTLNKTTKSATSKTASKKTTKSTTSKKTADETTPEGSSSVKRSKKSGSKSKESVANSHAKAS